MQVTPGPFETHSPLTSIPDADVDNPGEGGESMVEQGSEPGHHEYEEDGDVDGDDEDDEDEEEEEDESEEEEDESDEDKEEDDESYDEQS